MFSDREYNRIIEMAWEDRTPFEAIKYQFDISEHDVIKIMRNELKRSSFNLWRKRVNSGVSSKHLKKEAMKFLDLNVVDKAIFHQTKYQRDKRKMNYYNCLFLLYLK